MRASLQAVYGVRLSAHDYSPLELADLVAGLPPGCALWRASGGQLAWSDEMHMLARIEHGIRVLAWMKTEDGQKGRKQPKPHEPPRPGREVREEEARARAKYEAWAARQERAAKRASSG